MSSTEPGLNGNPTLVQQFNGPSIWSAEDKKFKYLCETEPACNGTFLTQRKAT
jgi:hypothetical protein